MPEIKDYTETCDRLKDECDRLLYSVDRADLKIDLLNASAGNMEAQIRAHAKIAAFFSRAAPTACFPTIRS